MMKLQVFLTLLALSAVSNIYADSKNGISGFINDLTSSEGYFERKKIREWYKKNKGKLVIVNGSVSLGCGIKDENYDLYDCNFNAQIINHTGDEITGLVLKFQVHNKSKNALVTEEIETLVTSIYPTVEKSVNINFTSSKVGSARSQLGANGSWVYELIAYLPDHLHKKDWWYSYDWLAE